MARSTIINKTVYRLPVFTMADSPPSSQLERFEKYKQLDHLQPSSASESEDNDTSNQLPSPPTTASPAAEPVGVVEEIIKFLELYRTQGIRKPTSPWHTFHITPKEYQELLQAKSKQSIAFQSWWETELRYMYRFYWEDQSSNTI